MDNLRFLLGYLHLLISILFYFFTLQRKDQDISCLKKTFVILLHKFDSRAHNSIEIVKWMHNTTVKALSTASSLDLVILQQIEVLTSVECYSAGDYMRYIFFLGNYTEYFLFSLRVSFFFFFFNGISVSSIYWRNFVDIINLVHDI